MTNEKIDRPQAAGSKGSGGSGHVGAPDQSEGPDMRPFWVLWCGQAVSLLGSQAVQFGLIWWLTLETGSAALLATGTLLALLPRALAGPVIGALVDRWDRRWVMLAADGALALAAAALAGLFYLGEARPAHLLILLFLRGIAGAFHESAMLASTSLMVPESALTRVQGLNQAVQGLLLIAAPPLGALLVSRLPMVGVVSVDVVTALFAIVPLLLIAVPRPHRSPDRETSSIWLDTLDGLRFLRERGGHLVLLAIAALLNLFLTPAFSLLPLLVHDHGGGATRLAWASSALGVGLLVGGVLLGVWGGFRRRILTSLTGLVALGIAVLAMVLVPVASALFLIALLSVGAMSAMINGPIQAILQATVEPRMQGRVFALYGSLASITAPVGLAVAAPVAEVLGVSSWYLAGGVTAMALGVGGLFVPALLAIEPAEPTGAKEPSREADRSDAEGQLVG